MFSQTLAHGKLKTVKMKEDKETEEETTYKQKTGEIEKMQTKHKIKK